MAGLDFLRTGAEDGTIEDSVAEICIDTGKALGPIKMMNCVNNGPAKACSVQTRTNFKEFKALEIPYARTHDSAHCHEYGGSHSVDISGIFPDFSKDPYDSASYDFVLTDDYLKTMMEAGTEPFYRLGQSIENWIKKYGANPPSDFGKWAVVCEHIVRHYNEGWADGFHWNIKYWEIWNEPDDPPPPDTPSGQWTGTEEQFFELYGITASHLKKCFPDLKIGGPAHSVRMDWAERFLDYLTQHGAPLDFFSWHRYFVTPDYIPVEIREKRALLDRHGFEKAESILNEWNYVRGWTSDWVYSLRVESGDLNYKGAAFVAASMSVCQREALDMLMYYDARLNTAMNGMFDPVTLEPMRGYYPFAAWAKLRRLGMEVDCSCTGTDGLYATAAASADGRLGLLVTRYSDDDNISGHVALRISAKGRSLAGARCHMTDKVRMFTEVFPGAEEDGSVIVNMQPQSFLFLELD